jgi:hypothetical protein
MQNPSQTIPFHAQTFEQVIDHCLRGHTEGQFLRRRLRAHLQRVGHDGIEINNEWVTWALDIVEVFSSSQNLLNSEKHQ